jgi:hypothetical protein
MPAIPMAEPIAKTHSLPQRSERAPPITFPVTVHAPPSPNTHPSVTALKPRSSACATWWVVTIW